MDEIQYDIFISYSTEDDAFAGILERQLETYLPPAELTGLKQLRVFRYEVDMRGVDYHEAITDYLKTSERMIVICSPAARASAYVNEEIALFTQLKPSAKIIPLLVAGIPNNEGPGSVDAAFPERLYLKYAMPLAINFKSFKPGSDKLNRGFYENSWYALLAEIYDIPRETIEQREKKRARIRLIRTRSIIAAILTIILAFAVVALFQRHIALKNANIALSDFYASESLRIGPSDVRQAAESALAAFDLDQNPLSVKAIYTSYYDQPYYKLIENLSFNGSNELYDKRGWKFLYLDQIHKELSAINADGYLRIYDTKTFRRKDSVLLNSSPDCLYPTDGNTIIIGCIGGEIYQYKRAERKLSLLTNEHGKIVEIKADNDKRLLMIGCENTLVIKKAVAAKLLVYDSLRLGSTITKISIHGDKALIITYNQDVIIYNLKKKIVEFRKSIDDLIDADVAGDSLVFVTSKVAFLDSLHFFNLHSQFETVKSLEGVHGIMMGARVLCRNHLLISQYNGVGIQLWDFSGNKICFLRGGQNTSTNFAFSNGGRIIYTGDDNGKLKEWRVFPKSTALKGKTFGLLKDGIKKNQLENLLRTIKNKTRLDVVRKEIDNCERLQHAGKLAFFSIKADSGRFIFYTATNKKIYTSYLEQRADQLAVKDSLDLNYYNEIYAIGTNTSELLAYSGSGVILWDMAGKRTITPIDIRDKQVLALDLSQNAKMMAVCFYDYISLYDYFGKFICNIPMPDAPEQKATDIVFSTDGKQLLASLADGTILSFDLNADQMSRVIKKRLQ